MGALLTGFLATAKVNGNLNTNLKDLVGNGLWIEQLKAIGVTIAMAVVGTTILAYLIKMAIGLRPSAEAEFQGLDLAEHGEAGYHYEDGMGGSSPTKQKSYV
jgi:Amt family ammonium transporter